MLKVGCLVTEHPEPDRPVPHAVLPQELHGAVQDRPRRFIVMEEVPSLKDEVHFVLLSQLEYLLKRVDRVLTTYRVLLDVAKVVVGGCTRTDTQTYIQEVVAVAYEP